MRILRVSRSKSPPPTTSWPSHSRPPKSCPRPPAVPPRKRTIAVTTTAARAIKPTIPNTIHTSSCRTDKIKPSTLALTKCVEYARNASSCWSRRRIASSGDGSCSPGAVDARAPFVFIAAHSSIQGGIHLRERIQPLPYERLPPPEQAKQEANACRYQERLDGCLPHLVFELLLPHKHAFTTLLIVLSGRLLPLRRHLLHLLVYFLPCFLHPLAPRRRTAGFLPC